MPRTIQQQIKDTYFALRVGAAVIAFAFPLLLWSGGKIAGITLRDSMSAYYWATPTQLCPCGENPDHSCQKGGTEVDTHLTETRQEEALQPGTMRSWFVGLLFAIGTILFVNQGHSRKEGIALNIAGVLAIGVALVPLRWDCKRHAFSLHAFCAVSFFLCIAFISAVCSRDSLAQIKDIEVRAKYRKAYVALAIAMVASPVAAYVFNFVTLQHSLTFWAELFGIYAFAGYWCVKTKEMSGPDVRRMLAEEPEQAAV